MQRGLDRPPEDENHECDTDRHAGDLPLADAARNSERRCHPDRRRRRESYDIAAVGVEDDAAAKKADAGDDTLNHARHGGHMRGIVRASELQRRDRDEGGAERDEGVRAKARRLPRQLSIETDRAADARGGD